jgi:hypothetical protein
LVVLHPVVHTLSRLSEEPALATTLQGVYFICLYVSALVGHPQVEYTTISGRYFTHTGSAVLCHYVLFYCICPANTLIDYLMICNNLDFIAQLPFFKNIKEMTE